MRINFQNGYIEASNNGFLKEWHGCIKRKRKGKFSRDMINISHYFKDYEGFAFITASPDEGKTLFFRGTGPLHKNKKEIEL